MSMTTKIWSIAQQSPRWLHSSLLLLCVWFSSLLVIPTAEAEPLNLSELNRFNSWVQCTERCATRLPYDIASSPTYEEQRDRFQCLQSCGVPAHTWEKDGARRTSNRAINVYPIDRHDLKLAILEFQSRGNLGDDAEEINAQFSEFGVGFDPSQLICYGDLLLETGDDPQEEQPEAHGSMVIVGTLCPYDEDSNVPHYSCPYLVGTEVDESDGNFYQFCDAERCTLPEFNFNSALAPADSDGVYWAGTYRPFVCPKVVCDLYRDDAELEGDVALCEAGSYPHVPRWLERSLGGKILCDLNAFGAEACGLNERCVYNENFGRGICESRCPAGESCTVAHLELKSETDQELVAWVYFDHSDSPVRALDLHFTYPRDQLVLADSRRLPALVYSGGRDGKQLATQHLPDGTLRLSVFDTTNSDPIPYGPIIELVFQRTGDEEVTIEFTDDDALREMSMAPNHAQAQEALKDPEVWGPALRVGPRSQAAVQLKLWYDFQNLDDPLKLRDVHSGEALCDLISECALEPEEAFQDRLIHKLDRLQRGESSLDKSIEGVLRDAGYLNGSQSHIRLPITMSEELSTQDQSFSLSTWFYTEGHLPNEDIDVPQIIFAHHNRSERTRFGVWLRADDSNNQYILELFDGDLLARTLTQGLTTLPLAEIPLREWQHFSFTYDAETRLMKFYLNGEPLSMDYQFPIAGPSPLACPQFSRGRELILQEEGSFLGGEAPHTLYYAVRESGLYKVKRRDIQGSSDQLVLGDGEFSYSQPDYSPILNKVVYVSNATGSDEIWIANGDGSQRHRLTSNFGDADLGMGARAPRWAPDGSGIVFESNAFDIIAQDNITERVYHLYYIAYDARENEPAIPLADGTVTDQLDYQARLDDQSLVFYRLTEGDNRRHHRKARWLEGRVADRDQRGRLLFEHASPRYQQKGVSELLIDEVIPLSTMNTLSGLNTGELAEEVSLLDAKRHVRASVTGPEAVERLLYKRSYAILNELGNPGRLLRDREVDGSRESPHELSLHVADIDATEHTATIELRYRPELADFSLYCWDRNNNGLRDNDEDTNGDNEWNERDCILSEISQFFVELDVGLVALVGIEEINPTMDTTSIPEVDNITRNPWNKEARLTEQSSPGKTYVSLQITSPYNTYPLDPLNRADGLVLARFKIRSVNNEGAYPIDTLSEAEIKSTLTLIQRTAEEDLVVRDLNPSATCWDLNQNRIAEPFEDRNEDGEFNQLDCVDQVFEPLNYFEQVRDAQLSPDADQILLDAISLSRPMLLLTADLISANGILNLSERSAQLKGLSWSFDERYFPCNWVGATQHPTQKKLMSALRGGLDELKLHLGIRNLHSIRSEAERGLEWLDRAGELTSQRPRCGASHLECPPFHLCIESECVVTPCDISASADEDGSCAPYGAQCRLRPVTIESEEAGVTLSGGADYVCVADCNSDRECYTQTCLNGPCLFCDVNTSACAECRQIEVELNGLTTSRVEGCPDERSFYCDAGACLTECYSFEDDQSLYLCDPVTEFCDQGRCVLRDWEWEDLSPMTFMGAADAQFDLDPSQWSHYTVAIGESYPVEINAYGVTDYGASPEILVEVRGGPFYGGTWHQLGRVAVHHRTQADANRAPMRIDSVHPYTDLRMRLVTSPYQNVTASATGLGELDKHFCIDDVTRSWPDLGQTSARARCDLRAQGSRYQLGYRIDLPEFESIKYCRDRGHAGCSPRGRSENDYLYGGAPGVIILDVKSNGGSVMNALSRNPICSYAGGTRPVSLEGGPEKIFYGRISAERSNQRSDYCTRYPDRCFVGVNETATIGFEGSFALLNCNYTNTDQPSDSVYAEFVNIPYLPPAIRSGVITLDDGDSCIVAIDNLRSEVCYEWAGGAVSFDPYTHEEVVNQSLEMSVSRSFGHDRGFTPVPPPLYRPRVQITGYTGSGLVLTSGRGDLVEVESQATEVSLNPIYEGWFYRMEIASQPLEPTLTCSFVQTQLPLEGNAVEAMNTTPFSVVCERAQPITGCVNYVTNACRVGTEEGKMLSVRLTSIERVGGQQVSRQQVTHAFVDSHFSFPRSLKEGSSFQVDILTSPPGVTCVLESPTASTLVGAGVAPEPISISCEDRPSFPLRYQLSGLGTSTLTLIDRESQSVFEVSSDDVDSEGIGTLSLNLREREAYSIQVSQQPEGITCEINQGSGVMPINGFPESQAIRITCSHLETYELSIPVMGLTPPESVTVNLIHLSQEGTEVSRGSAVFTSSIELSVDPEAGSLTFSSPRLYQGARYRLEIESVSSELDSCSVRNLLNPTVVSDFEFDNGLPFQPLMIYCQRESLVDEGFEISGRIENLDASGLKLTLNNSPVLLPIEEGQTDFTFYERMIDDSPYDVTVARQPDYRYCRVINGSGRISGADISGIIVRCQPSGDIEVTLSLPTSEGADIQFKLFSSPQNGVAARLIGAGVDNLKVEQGVATSVIVSPDGGGTDPLSLPVGTYHLYVFINTNGSFDRTSNKPTFGVGDHGFYQVINVQPDRTTRVGLTNSTRVPLLPVHVIAAVFEGAQVDLDEEDVYGAPMTCTFSPPRTFMGTGMPPPNNTQQDAPVVSFASRFCTSDCELEERSFVTTRPAYLPLIPGTSYDLFCYVDVNDSDGIDRGDLVGAISMNTLLWPQIGLILTELTE